MCRQVMFSRLLVSDVNAGSPVTAVSPVNAVSAERL